jgi:DNA invertase Pin-like site-specific DNA recombinase
VRFISYNRVSTDKQGRSGLGREAQQAAVAQHAATVGGTIVCEYVEVESGRNNARPQLAAALAHCKRIGATLVIAKLDRLARNVAFIAGLMESGVPFVACDMPHAKAFELHIYAALAEQEAHMISARTKAALAAAKARGVILGGYKGGPAPDHKLGVEARQAGSLRHAERVADIVRPMRDAGATYEAIAERLTADHVQAARGGTVWTATAVRRVIVRLGALSPTAQPVAPRAALAQGALRLEP